LDGLRDLECCRAGQHGASQDFGGSDGTLARGSSTLSPVPEHVPAHLVYDFDYIYDERLVQEPHERMKSLLAEAPPIFYSPRYGGHWVVTRKKALAEITRDTERFSSRSLGIPPASKIMDLIPVTFDPPQHTAYRMPLAQKFSAKGVEPQADTIRKMAIDLIDAVADRGHCDFLLEVAEPLPPTVFFVMAGMPTDRLREFRQLAEAATAAPEAHARQAAIGRITEILAETVRDRMAEPRDDLVSDLVTKEFGGRKLRLDEILNYAVLLFLGGLETVVNLLCFSVRHLAMDQTLQSQLRAEPSLIPVVTEEFLRLHAIAMTVRTVTRDLEYEGVRLRRGDQLLLLVPAVNFDPAAFEHPNDLRPGRKEAHVTFNMGPHRCIGANLARLEARIFFEEWLRRIPTFHLDPGKPPQFFGGLNLAIRTLPLVWQPRQH
jgi:cytochrome P450